MFRATSPSAGHTLYSKCNYPLHALDHALAKPQANAYVSDTTGVIDDNIQPSEYISKQQATRLIQAAAYAFCSGHPLNRYVVLHLDDPNTAHEHLTAFIKHIGDWLRYRSNAGLYYVWTLECRPQLHLNILIHIPYDHLLAFRRHLNKWLREMGLVPRKGLIKSIPIRHSAPGNNSSDYLCKGLRGLLRYVLKGIDPTHAARFGIKPAYQGTVKGKRCGRSESLSPASYIFPSITVRQHFRLAGPEYRRRHLLQLAWGNQSTGEYVKDVHFPLPAINHQQKG